MCCRFMGLLHGNGGTDSANGDKDEVDMVPPLSQPSQAAAGGGGEAATAVARTRADARRNLLRGTAQVILSQELLPGIVALRNHMQRVEWPIIAYRSSTATSTWPA